MLPFIQYVRSVKVLQPTNLTKLINIASLLYYRWRDNKSVQVKDTNALTSFCTSQLTHVLPSAWNFLSPPKDSNLFFPNSQAESPLTSPTLH